MNPPFALGRRQRRWSLGGLMFCVVAVAGLARAADDDVIIMADPVVAGADGTIVLGDDDDDDSLIIIVDDEKTPLPVPKAASGPLGSIWDSWHVAADTDFLAAAQWVDPADGPLRLLAAVTLESWLLPTDNLGFYGTAFARLAIDSTESLRVVPFLDVYELYARVNVDRAVVQLGRLVVPWGRMQATAFGDRLNPPDLRRGGPFPDPAQQKQPQMGAQVKGSLGIVGVEAVAFATYEATEGALAASQQGGVRVGRYQQALVRSPARAAGFLTQDDTAALRPLTQLGQPTLALRAWRRLGEVDVTASAAWHFDDTPSLDLNPDLRKVLAAEALDLLGLVTVPLPSPPVDVCGGSVALRCLGGRGAVSHNRTTSFAVDATWGLGLVVAKAEAVAFPLMGGAGGKTAILVDDSGLRSVQVNQFAAAVGVEGQLGPAIDGSLEVFNVTWAGVPATARLWGVELLDDEPRDADGDRLVHRLAAAARLGGALLDEKLLWRLRGEAGVFQPDMLISAEVRYRLPVFDLYVGGRGDVFTGLPGSPGWMRQDATLFGLFLGEGA